MSRDTSFYYAFLVLPPRKRTATIAVWDFCRAVDDAVDEADAPERAAEQVGAWRAELDAAFGGGPLHTWQGRALQPFLREFNLPRQPFEELIDGVEMDLAHWRYATFDALAEYLPPRRIGCGPHLCRDLRLLGSTHPVVCGESRHRAPVDQHRPRYRR